MVKTSPSNAGDTGLIPGQGTKIPQAPQLKKKKNPKPPGRLKHKTEIVF